MSRASESILEELHNTIAQTLTDELKRYADGKFKDEDGKPKPIPASFLQMATKFLKDNGIDRPEDDEPDPEDLLSDELPSFGEEV